jgi:type II secretion system protein G
MRYCPSCYAPLKGRQTGKTHLDAVKGIATTKRPDPTVVFLPEVREALQLHKRRRQRWLIIASLCLLLVVVLALSIFEWNRQQEARRHLMARQHAALKELRMLADGLENFRADMGRYPTEKEGLESLTNRTRVSNPGTLTDEYYWQGPYVNGRYELDPWGNEYQYQTTDDGLGFELFSDGAEGLGTEVLRVSSQSRSES